MGPSLADARADELLEFWFEPDARARDESAWLAGRRTFWFEGGPDVDRCCRERFAGWIDAAARGELASFESTPRGALALVVALDQLPRNVHRGSPRAFAFDPLARAAAERALARRDDEALGPLERGFLYLPFEHAEDRGAQERSVALFGALAARAPAPLRETLASWRDFAERHRDVIARFGRFPHRNAILGRASTPEEIAYLAEPGSGF
jgi:uncharacterized protein (DUF924 family)